MLIVLSGQPGAGKSVIGQLLAERLNLRFFSAGHLWKSLGKGTLESEFYYSLFREECQKKEIDLSAFVVNRRVDETQAVWNSSLGKNKNFHEAIDNLQRWLASKRDIVIEGKLAVHMVESQGLKVWIKADFEKRAERISLRDKISLEEARMKLKERDHMERSGWLQVYGFDPWTQEQEADLVIDTTRLSREEAIDLILEKLG